jgi:glucans biosynthesis protein
LAQTFRFERIGLPDQFPDMAPKGGKRCRMHGGADGSGAPKGNRNALKHGRYTAEALADRRYVRELMREARELEALILGSVG